jgi:hypothetical protein
MLQPVAATRRTGRTGSVDVRFSSFIFLLDIFIFSLRANVRRQQDSPLAAQTPQPMSAQGGRQSIHGATVGFAQASTSLICNSGHDGIISRTWHLFFGQEKADAGEDARLNR